MTKKDFKNSKHRIWQALIALVLTAGIVAAIVIPSTIASGDEKPQLPKLDISLNGVTLDEVKAGTKKIKYPGNTVVLTSGEESQEFSGVELKGRGNSTWGQPKSPFQLKFSEKTGLLGMREAKKWILLANAFDATNLRNDIAMLLAEVLESDYTRRGEFVELFVDEEREGLYYLVPKIGIGKDLLPLDDDWGVLMEMDNLHEDEDKYYVAESGESFVVKDAVNEDDEDILAAATDDFIAAYNELTKAAEVGDFARVSELADVESFVKYYLINEFTVNTDAYTSSFYFYKNGKEDVIYAGPIWDFDLAMANPTSWISGDENFFSPIRTMSHRDAAYGLNGKEEDKAMSKLIYNLMEIPEFKAEVSRVFSEKMSGKKTEIIAEIEKTADIIREPAKTDQEKYGYIDFDTELEYLLDWLRLRFDYFERTY